MKQSYIERRFTPSSEALIETINDVCEDYAAQGFVLTVRQLYYQLVARNIIANNERSYQNTTSLVNDARLAGRVDWDAIEDRTREFITRPSWEDGKVFMQQVAPQFHSDMWSDQRSRVFMIVEKEALVGVLEKTCRAFDVPLLAARGYPSVSVLREFAIEKILPHAQQRQDIQIIHLGDHDPSGIDMTRDLIERLRLLTEYDVQFGFERVALSMDQIEENDCPPNPAKLSDSRAGKYISLYGAESWELDALEPSYLVNLAERKIKEYIEGDLWRARVERNTAIREKLEALSKRFKA